MPLILTGEGPRGGDPILKMLRRKARQMGFSNVAAECGISRETLYRSLGEAGNPRLCTMVKLCQVLKVALTVRPARKSCG